MAELDSDIALWRAAVTKAPAVDAADADELESHLREQVAELSGVGLSESEAFQIAVQRLGKVDELTAEFAREHGERLWKQLKLDGDESGERTRRPLVEMVIFALVAALVIQVARLLADFPNEPAPWLFRNLGLFVLPVLAAYFAWTRRVSPRVWLVGAASVAVMAVAINLYPYAEGSQTQALIAIHLPILLWFAIGITYLGGARQRARRMEFVRFTGEWFIYWVLLALGGGVLVALTVLILGPLAPAATDDITLWVIPSGGAAAVIVAAWLVEAKKGVIENLAPVLTAIFTPLFAVMLLVASIAYLFGGAWQLFGATTVVAFDRDLITVFDVLLIVVLGLVLYALSARDPAKPAGVLDALQLVAIAAALLLDAIVLSSMLARIAEFGVTPNRVVAIGLNVILIVNVAVTAVLSVRMLAGRTTSAALERWQTSYLPVFAAWAAVVVIALPVVFGFS
jgi:hypothetical protein